MAYCNNSEQNNRLAKQITKIDRKKINFASCTHNGNNRYQEDRVFADVIKVNDEYLHVFAVFDGHRGYAVSEMCRENLRRVIHLPNGCRIPALDKIAVENKLVGGSTATIVVYYPDGRIETERVGDSQAFTFLLKRYNKDTKKWKKVNKKGKSKELVLSDHSPTSINEFNRLMKDYPNAGWTIEYTHSNRVMNPRRPFIKINNEWQTNPLKGYIKKSVSNDYAAYIINSQGDGLGTVRAVGDLHFRDYGVISESDKETLQLDTNTYSVIVLGSDGLWDIYTLQEIYAIVSNSELVGKAEAASEILLNSAMKRGQDLYKDNVIDNISVVVVYIPLQQDNDSDDNSDNDSDDDSDDVDSDWWSINK